LLGSQRERPNPPQAESEERPPKAHRLLELDGLRAFAIFPVILYHCYPDHGLLRMIGPWGWAGVDLFFVLSGYLITGILLKTVHKPNYYKNFFARRTIRIFPLYYLCLAVFMIATKLTGPAAWKSMQEWGGWPWFVFFVGNVRIGWVNMWPPIFSVLPLWSLQVEEQFYILYPLIVSKLSTRSLRRLLIGVVFAATLLRMYLAAFVPGSTLASYVLMPCRMDALALGGLVALLHRSKSKISASPFVVSFAVALGVVILLGSVPFAASSAIAGTIQHSLIEVTFAALLAAIILAPNAKLVALLRLQPLVYSGRIAYGLYLLHVPAAWIARKLVFRFTSVDVHGLFVDVPITFGAAFIAASLSWHFLELPILALKARFSSDQSEPIARTA